MIWHGCSLPGFAGSDKVNDPMIDSADIAIRPNRSRRLALAGVFTHMDSDQRCAGEVAGLSIGGCGHDHKETHVDRPGDGVLPRVGLRRRGIGERDGIPVAAMVAQSPVDPPPPVDGHGRLAHRRPLRRPGAGIGSLPPSAQTALPWPAAGRRDPTATATVMASPVPPTAARPGPSSRIRTMVGEVFDLAISPGFRLRPQRLCGHRPRPVAHDRSGRNLAPALRRPARFNRPRSAGH